uniref:ABC transporter domain-containing protein n=1 Tax=Marmota marmota marmota TaxID=9994 RepID=A0A8C5YVG0_MARMA
MASIDPKSFTQGTVLSIHNICYRVKEKSGFLLCRRTFEREVLTNIKYVHELFKILKTYIYFYRLLDILAARKDPNGLSGDVLINGAPRPANFKCNSGFMVQDDFILGTLTVRENLAFSAALRLPTTMTKHEKDEWIKVVIEELGLDEVADSKVGSGEERKKTSIAMGLITDPSILFLDEPTTGLDSSTSNPQNSIFKLFDSLTLLASGKLMYHGPAQKALEYFESAGYHCELLNNPSDFFMDVINGDSPAAVTAMQEEGGEANETEQLLMGKLPVIERLAQFYSKSAFYRETETELERLSGGQHSSSNLAFKEITYVTTFCHQFRWILWRSFRNLMSHPQPWIVQITIILILGLIVGGTFLQLKNDCTEIQNSRLIWAVPLGLIWDVWCVFLFCRHEYLNGYYRVSSYFLGKLLFDLLFGRFFPSFIFTLVLYLMLGLKRGITAFLITMITTLMVAYSTTAMILAIGIHENAASGKTLLVIVYFVFMLVFLGMSLNFETMTPQLSWLQYFSIPHYGYMALQHNEFLEQKFCSGPNTTMSNCRPSFLICTGEEFLIIQGLDLSPWSIWKNILSLACMMIIFLTIVYLKLLFLKKTFLNSSVILYELPLMNPA